MCGNPNGPIFACGEKLGGHFKSSAQIAMSKTTPPDSWMGFTSRFPLGEGPERAAKDGFGVRYEGKLFPLPNKGDSSRSIPLVNRHCIVNATDGKASQATIHKICAMFSLGGGQRYTSKQQRNLR